ncbi:BLUF domain-containing protein [Mangrovicoccus sp. HB161399]|uniref:BLUF domain-containing protein n=1 Tax=Mangrovicoccus sp. HB161399 TaxID=2720392 RepID=UPI00155233E4|nr:BLUF domain-containing protein [Mangrovicoccus sp. HB161399]
MIHQLIYVSQARRPFDGAALAGLLGHSRSANAAGGVTGLLIYREDSGGQRGHFLQILEGAEETVEATWARIRADRRHHSLLVLSESTVSGRMFGGWSMGFRNVDAADLAAFAGFEDLGSDAFWQRARRDGLPGALELLRSFYEPA